MCLLCIKVLESALVENSSFLFLGTADLGSIESIMKYAYLSWRWWGGVTWRVQGTCLVTLSFDSSNFKIISDLIGDYLNTAP